MKTSRLFNFILDLIFPKECVGCGKEGVFLCPGCASKIKLIDYSACPFCKRISEKGSTCNICKKNHRLDGLTAAAEYENTIIRKTIKTYKFKFVKELHIPLANLIINNTGTEDILLPQNKFDFIVPVPLHRKRLNWRGFNQSELVALKLSEYFNIPINRDILIRVKNTPPQSKTKSKKEREENIKNAFAVNKNSQIQNKNFILVDDVCSTAFTLDECAKTLKQAEAKKVWGCVIARGR